MTQPATQRHGFSSTDSRYAKARKIRKILSEFGHPITESKRILDIGTGNGEIASMLATETSVIAVDVVDQRTCKRGYSFVRAGEKLPFPDHSFDIVISNHVIEHVPGPGQHIREIQRILAPQGVLYLATPNRWWPWEFHHRVLLLHYLPPPWFRKSLQFLGRYREDLILFSLPGLRRLCQSVFNLYPFHDRVCRRPRVYSLNVPKWLNSLLGMLPSVLFRLSVSLQPTLILLLTPKNSND